MSLQEVFVDELRDLYSAETQLVKAMPKLAKTTKNPELKQTFSEHLEQTKGQVERLKQIFSDLGEKPTGKTCHGMQGLIEEAQEELGEDMEPELKDLALSGAGIRVEHYEVAGYTTAILIAKQLGHKEIASTLTEILNEEKETAKRLLAGAKPILKQAAQVGQEEEEEEE
jgi:ferritin-like metal-binding protein YciE